MRQGASSPPGRHLGDNQNSRVLWCLPVWEDPRPARMYFLPLPWGQPGKMLQYRFSCQDESGLGSFVGQIIYGAM